MAAKLTKTFSTMSRLFTKTVIVKVVFWKYSNYRPTTTRGH